MPFKSPRFLLPVSLEIDGAQLIFVGGGKAIERKILQLLSLMPENLQVAQVPSILIIAPDILPEIKAALNSDCRMSGKYSLIERGFEAEDLRASQLTEQYCLVWAMTSDSALNQEIGLLCRKQGIWCNASGARSFRQGAVLNQSNFLVSVQSIAGEDRLDGARPAAAAALRDRIQELLCTCP